MTASEIPPALNQDSVSIKFSVTFFDLLKCRFWRVNRQPNFLMLNLAISALIACHHWNDPETQGKAIGFKIFFCLILATMMYLFLMAVNLILQTILIFSGKNRGLTGAMELTIRNDGLLEKTEVSESLHRWTGFQKIRASQNYFFLYVTDSNALYVPKRSFPTTLEAVKFEAAILERLAKR